MKILGMVVIGEILIIVFLWFFIGLILSPVKPSDGSLESFNIEMPDDETMDGYEEQPPNVSPLCEELRNDFFLCLNYMNEKYGISIPASLFIGEINAGKEREIVICTNNKLKNPLWRINNAELTKMNQKEFEAALSDALLTVFKYFFGSDTAKKILI